jgi:hypothetical protein
MVTFQHLGGLNDLRFSFLVSGSRSSQPWPMPIRRVDRPRLHIR